MEVIEGQTGKKELLKNLSLLQNPKYIITGYCVLLVLSLVGKSEHIAHCRCKISSYSKITLNS